MKEIKFSLSETEDSLGWHVDNYEWDDELVNSFENGDYVKVIKHLKKEASDIYDGDVVLVNYDDVYYLPKDKYQVINIDGSSLYVIELSSNLVNRYVEPRDYVPDEFEDNDDIFLMETRAQHREEIESVKWDYLILCVM